MPERVDLSDPAVAARDRALRGLDVPPSPRILQLHGEALAGFLEVAYEALHIRAEDTDALRIECNWCSGGDYLWVDGEDSVSSGAWEAAVEHLTSTHRDRLTVKL